MPVAVGAAHAIGTAGGQAARIWARKAGAGPFGQAVTVTIIHSVTGLASAPADVAGALTAPASAIAHGIATYKMAKRKDSRKVRAAAAW